MEYEKSEEKKNSEGEGKEKEENRR